ncbi:MAG: nucleoside triphosphate pyrophosphohydrolase [Acidobacteriota bacterium]|nr:nucleoside triphosphate pyrophosphohydrolase [Acidobacteriota bacterium]
MTKPDPHDSTTLTDSAGNRFDRLVEIMRTLRSPNGCAWDREQTLSSLRPFVLEEAYEVVEAMDRDDPTALCDELGDLMLEAVFVAQICTEQEHFTIVDATNAIINKLIRRHPHIFDRDGTRPARELSAREVKEQWERIKIQERAGSPDNSTMLDGIPKALPSLLRASRIGARTANVGFDWNAASDVIEKADEEMAELRDAISSGDGAHIQEELGDLLFTIANLARKLRIDPESALRTANDKFTRRFRSVEQQLGKRNRTLHEATRDELEHEWQVVKKTEPVR